MYHLYDPIEVRTAIREAERSRLSKRHKVLALLAQHGSTAGIWAAFRLNQRKKARKNRNV